jgi:hypothetical protein
MHTIIGTVPHENSTVSLGVMSLVSTNINSKVLFNNGTIYVVGPRRSNNILLPQSYFIFRGIRNVTIQNRLEIVFILKINDLSFV